MILLFQQPLFKQQPTDLTMNTSSSLKQMQYEFAANIRDPEQNDIPEGIEPRRMKIYQELFFNNIEGFISSAFPVIRTLFDEQQWHQIVREFMVNHRCHSPVFAEIAIEFLDYLSGNGRHLLLKYPFMLELAHYEWVEVAVVFADEENTVNSSEPDWLEEKPVVSSVSHILAYDYPVHLISKDFSPTEEEKQATFLVVYRDKDDNIGFMELNAVSYRLLSLINGELTGKVIIDTIAEELHRDDVENLYPMALELFDSFSQKNILLGTV